jgi:hypothetical protein
MDYSQERLGMGLVRIPACRLDPAARRWLLPQHRGASAQICEVSLARRERVPDKTSMLQW